MTMWEIRIDGENSDDCRYESTVQARNEAENYHRVVEAETPATAIYKWEPDGGEQRLNVRYDGSGKWFEPTDVTLAPVRDEIGTWEGEGGA